MNKKRWVATVVAIVSGAFSMLGERGEALAARSHAVVVTVDASSRMIEVDVPELRVRGQNHNIFWTLENGPGQSYSFPEDGIHFKTSPGQSEFTCMRQNRTKFKCHDKGITKGRFEYGVKLQGAPAVPVLDPFVINN